MDGLGVFVCGAAHRHDPRLGGECWMVPSVEEVIEWLLEHAASSTYADRAEKIVAAIRAVLEA